MTSQPLRPDTIDRLTSAVYPSFAMLAEMELDLFTPLKNGPMTAGQVAQELEVRPDRLKPLLYALGAAGLLIAEEDRFSNTLEADHFLVRGGDAYIGARHRAFPRRWDGVLKTAETIRTGIPQDLSDFSSMPADRMEALARNRESEVKQAVRVLMARYDFSSYKALLDVGWGAGYLSIAMAQASPHLQATVVDLPTVTPIAQQVVAESGLSDRVQVVTADVVNESLNGSFDLAILKSVIQVLSADQARIAIRNVGQVLQPGGAIYILGRVIDDSRTTPLETVGQNLVFLNLYHDGQAYTEQELREWLAEAGCDVDFERVTLPDGSGIIKARKPG